MKRIVRMNGRSVLPTIEINDCAKTLVEDEFWDRQPPGTIIILLLLIDQKLHIERLPCSLYAKSQFKILKQNLQESLRDQCCSTFWPFREIVGASLDITLEDRMMWRLTETNWKYAVLCDNSKAVNYQFLKYLQEFTEKKSFASVTTSSLSIIDILENYVCDMDDIPYLYPVPELFYARFVKSLALVSKKGFEKEIEQAHRFAMPQCIFLSILHMLTGLHGIRSYCILMAMQFDDSKSATRLKDTRANFIQRFRNEMSKFVNLNINN